MKPQIVIQIQSQAADKPAEGAPCNGCGVCCLSEPCPLGIVLSRQRSGACIALRWDEAQRQYRCGALTDAADVMRQALPPGLRWLAPAIAPGLVRLGRRWIAAGVGCDCSLEVQRLAVDHDGESGRQSPP